MYSGWYHPNGVRFRVIAGYGGCECHDDVEHDHEYSCACESCQSYTLDIIYDQQCEKALYPDL